MLWSALLSWITIGIVVPVLISIGVGVLSMGPPDFQVSKVCFTAAALLLALRIGWWLAIELQPGVKPATKMVFTFILMGGVGALWVASLNWVARRETLTSRSAEVRVFDNKSLEMMARRSHGTYAAGTIIGGIKWVADYVDVRITLNNPSNADYEKIDFLLEPDSPIVGIGQVSDMPNVSFVGDVTKDTVDIGGVIAMMPSISKQDAKGRQIEVQLRQLSAPRYRVICQRIPPKGSIQLVLAIAEVDRRRNKSAFSLYPTDHPGDTSLPPTILGPIGDKVFYRRSYPVKLSIEGTYSVSSMPMTVKETLKL